ncbi:hypothetical protein LPJ66_008692 [Kickxella alabastrina]|uniref:Uncharacterized protein n=1 Tax=Kickxella alabastrina TaxID=61397 RepID=A0ACC1IBK1_9FUNG|nr:hypothetical protein LPJ66_008692 [Kickxella alabastrina]
MDKPTPRINASMLQQYVNITVRLAGRIVEAQGNSFLLETSDGKTVTVNPAVAQLLRLMCARVTLHSARLLLPGTKTRLGIIFNAQSNDFF